MRLRLPFVSRRRHERDLADQARGYQIVIRCCETTHGRLARRNADLAAQLRAASREVAS